MPIPAGPAAAPPTTPTILQIRPVGRLQQPAASTRSIRYEVVAALAGARYDPTGDPVGFGFSPGTDLTVVPASVVAGAWETHGSGSTTRHYARCLVGPGGTVLAAGKYVVWVQVTDNPDAPLQPVNILTIT